MNARHGSRRGFALLAVLWVMASAAALGVTVSLAAREAVSAARNRAAATRAMWHAEGCLERARAAVGDALTAGASPRAGEESLWLRLDSVVTGSVYVANARCSVSMRAAGTSLDVNEVDEDMLRSLLVAASVDASRIDSMIAALLDWRDADDVVRPFGAEREWYVRAGRPPPRNAPLAARREIRLVRGFETPSVLDSLLGVERGRIPLAIAPVAVIAALPGIDAEAVARIAERRLHARWPVDPMTLGAALSQAARNAMLAGLPELSRWTAAEPDAWILSSRARDTASAISVMIEVRLVRAGARAALVRRRSWVE
jgi:general secretion pathway protein K